MKRSVQGKLASATHSQTESYLKPLFRKLRKKVIFVAGAKQTMMHGSFMCGFTFHHYLLQNLQADIKESITDIIKFMLEREYVKV